MLSFAELLVPGETTTPASNAKDPLTKALGMMFHFALRIQNS